MTKAISRAGVLLATAAGLACGRPAGQPAPAEGPAGGSRVLPLGRLFPLEMSGIPPEDTVVTFAVGTPRVIVLRHGPPDNTVFVELIFPDSAFAADSGSDSVTVVVRPRPGLYALDLASTVIPRRSGTIRFKYPIHFAAPLAALERYGSVARYERALAIGTLVDGINYALAPSTRPASDNLQAPLPGPGTYIVAAPR